MQRILGISLSDGYLQLLVSNVKYKICLHAFQSKGCQLDVKHDLFSSTFK